MLTTLEKILFVVAVLASLALTRITFVKMFKIIQRGQGKLRLDDLPKRALKGIAALVTQGGILRNRPVSSLFHYGVAWGFIFFMLVNLVDVLEGYVPGFRFLGDGVIAGFARAPDASAASSQRPRFCASARTSSCTRRWPPAA